MTLGRIHISPTSKSRVLRGEFCTVYLLPSPDTIRVQFSVSKKDIPLAVDRNHIKRRFRAIFKDIRLPKGAVRVQVRGGAKGASFAQLKAEIERIVGNTK